MFFHENESFFSYANEKEGTWKQSIKPYTLAEINPLTS